MIRTEQQKIEHRLATAARRLVAVEERIGRLVNRAPADDPRFAPLERRQAALLADVRRHRADAEPYREAAARTAALDRERAETARELADADAAALALAGTARCPGCGLAGQDGACPSCRELAPGAF